MPFGVWYRLLSCCLIASALSTLLLTGCGKPNPRREIKGKVTLKKEPLKEGVIDFIPLSKGTPEAPATKEAAIITNGEYKILAEAGLTPGKYKVIITSGDSTAPDDPNTLPGPGGNYVMKDRIPPEYNSKSKQEVEVTKDGPNQFDYDIP